MTAKQLKWLGGFTCLVMFFALLGGAVVSKTGSGLECGQDWPLCNGKLVPAYTIGSLIEYTHRLFSGLAGLMSLASMWAFWRYARERRDLTVYALLTLVFVIVQGAMGALAVIHSQSAPVMALHLGFSLIAFASSLMLALGARRQIPEASSGRLVPSVSKAFRNFTWFTALYSYIVVYLGAYVSHTDSQGGCSGWPLCNGAWIPELSGGVGIVFMHRVAAALLFIMTALLGHIAFWKHKELPELRALGIAAVLLCLLQVFSGAAVVSSLGNDQVYIFAALAHIVLISGLFGVLCYMSVRVGQLSNRRRNGADAAGRPVGDGFGQQNKVDMG
ncbi:heme A synthase [Paenibacillus sp. NFR01]|uniref:COX15/CtaA family protein n=1 Tax=Paenibacillus sp. NFR01 TaxID=1566279 RepID=UPI0008B868B5|nr:heme A synthase [Paenibacillus sp. NFR01]SEU19851.1 cytochrome c oxidase assembly protein subunit 15 [Paenibacillus sp. NFR01]